MNVSYSLNHFLCIPTCSNVNIILRIRDRLPSAPRTMPSWWGPRESLLQGIIGLAYKTLDVGGRSSREGTHTVRHDGKEGSARGRALELDLVWVV